MPPKKTNAAAVTSIGDKYKKLEPREHVLQRPGMYVGSIQEDSCDTWVMNDMDSQMIKKTIKYIPGLFKIFDEVLVNAIDHAVRLKTQKEKAGNSEKVSLMKTIKANINKETGIIEVFNDGDGIEIEKHPEHNIYIPEMIFGHMMTSANYDDDEERIIGGLNGLGAKLTNIFSKWFEVETVDADRKLLYKQRFEENMVKKGAPEITKYTKKPYTIIRFLPDFEKFGMKEMTDDMYQILKKRVYDACAVTENDITIYFNDVKLDYKNFEKYVDLFIGSKDSHTRVYEKISDRWEVVASYNNFNGFEQISFVNGIWTIRGGKHVEYIVNQIVKKLTDLIQKKKKDVTVKPQTIKDNLILFVKSTIVNPSFDSQSKETLTTPITKFGSKAEIGDKFIEKLYKSGIVEKILEISEIHNNKQLAKTDGKKRSVIRGLAKLEDANWAGTAKSKECTLVLCEGDSAQSMVISGLAEVGRDRFGAFPLKGKLMNVKDQTLKKIAENDEISNLKKILGLETGKDYNSVDDLRYGKIMILTDQDSVTGDTPLLLKDPNTGHICIKHIDDICNADWEYDINMKEYNLTNYVVWTEQGWTKINRVMRHRVTKKMFRVLTHTGVVDVTEDHSLLDQNKMEIRPKDCKVDMKLLHSFPILEENAIDIPINLNDKHLEELHPLASKLKIPYYQTYKKNDLISEIEQIRNRPQINIIFDTTYKVTEMEAWVMGLFWADGSCGVYKWSHEKKPYNRPRSYTFNRTAYSWHISNCDRSLLERSCSIMNELYDLKFHIIECRRAQINCSKAYKLVVDGGVKTKDLIEKYSSMYYKNSYTKYQNGNKVVPSFILNAETNIRRSFLEGVWAGDGSGHDLYKLEKRIDIESKVSTQCIYTLCKSLGYEVSLNHTIKKSKIYSLNITKAHQQDNPNRIKKIYELGESDQYVYDLETENHHFQAGVGQMIVHNTDGTHIRGLLFNMFHSMWPSLVKCNEFLTSMLTPIVKVTKGTNTLQFYNMTDYDNWMKENEQGKGWEIKYYKGLGTSTSDEAKQYFKDMKSIQYKYTGQNSDDRLDLAFNKKKADERKEWLGGYDRQRILDVNAKEVTYEDFIDKELIHFSNYDVERSIPNLCDGFKVSQRKILFACFKKNLNKEIKVAQLAGYVSENAAYHHGEASLQSAIVGMAQNFVGSNNINVLKPNGQFGTRRCGGKDAGSPRYIYTLLSDITYTIFKKNDNDVLTYLNDDGLDIEPEYYMPIIPMILVNGAIGIGTGFSTNVPCYNPKDIITVIRKLMNGDNVDEMELVPWYMGFKGRIEKGNGADKWVSRGCYHKVSATKVEITELPVGFWTQDFKELLEELLDKNQDIKNYESQYTATDIRFIIHFASSAALDSYMNVESNGYTKLENDLKLVSSKNLGTTNMYLFNSRCQIQKYDTPVDIIKDFYGVRLAYYQKRKDAMLKSLVYDIDLLNNKIRFIKEVVAERIVVHKMKKDDLEKRLRDDEYMMHEGKYDYILRIPIYNLTIDKVEELEKEKKKADDEISRIRDLDIKTWWMEDLGLFEMEYDKFIGSTVTGAPKKMSVQKKIIPMKK